MTLIGTSFSMVSAQVFHWSTPILMLLYKWQGHHIIVHTDTTVKQGIINKGWARNMTCLFLLQLLGSLAIDFNFTISAVHIPGKINELADTISRLHEPGRFDNMYAMLQWYHAPLYPVPASHVIPHLALPVSDLTFECRQLDREAASWWSQAFAPSIKATYTLHLCCFLKSCAQYRLCPCPADDNTIVRYASFLARSKSYGSVVQYLNIIRTIHQEFGLPVSSQGNWYLSTVLRGIKRAKGHRPTPKAPILPQHFAYDIPPAPLTYPTWSTVLGSHPDSFL